MKASRKVFNGTVFFNTLYKCKPWGVGSFLYFYFFSPHARWLQIHTHQRPSCLHPFWSLRARKVQKITHLCLCYLCAEMRSSVYSQCFSALLRNVSNSLVKVCIKCTQGCFLKEGRSTGEVLTTASPVSLSAAWYSGTTGNTGANSISAWNNSCCWTSQNVRPNCFQELLVGFLLGGYEWSQGQSC